MKSIHIDVETFSDHDLQAEGVYRYTESSNFDILLFAYSVDGSEVNVVDVACGEKIPDNILAALSDPTVTKWAFNASFERICLSRFLRDNYPQFFTSYQSNDSAVSNYLDPTGWKCSQVWSSYLDFPASLKDVGKALNLDRQKLDEGKDLIKFFCVPIFNNVTDISPARNLPTCDIVKWNTFKEYNRRDVETEHDICQHLSRYPVPDAVWQEYWLDQKINDRGIKIDIDFVMRAIDIYNLVVSELKQRFLDITGIENFNSKAAFKKWLKENGVVVDSLSQGNIERIQSGSNNEVKEAIEIYIMLSKASVKKYNAMMQAISSDNRARGLYKFYGASRSGRWSGVRVQLQNLPQNHMKDLAPARALVAKGDVGTISLLYDDVPKMLSELIRTAFVPRDGYKFIVADFSAIEARVIAYIANEQWRNEVFAKGEDIYCASASHMFGCTVVKNGENGHLRQKGKIAELALGYGGSVGALKSMGALELGLAEDELEPLVQTWRHANPNIVALWKNVDICIKNTLKKGVPSETNGIKFVYESGILFVVLPSNRCLCYLNPRIERHSSGYEVITYESNKDHTRSESYGAKFVENIVQGISRDILCYAMNNLSKYNIVAHVHDEVIIECREAVSVDTICGIMGMTPSWAPNLLLRADGYETLYYKKD